jgi:hypothetical protein
MESNQKKFIRPVLLDFSEIATVSGGEVTVRSAAVFSLLMLVSPLMAGAAAITYFANQDC